MIQDEDRENFNKKLETYYAEKIDEIGILKNEKTEIEKIQRDYSKRNLPQSSSHINGVQKALVESTLNKIKIRIDIAIELFKKYATEDKDYEWLCDVLCEWAEKQYERAVKTIDHYVKSRGIKVTISDSFIETPLFESKSKIKRKTEIARDSWKEKRAAASRKAFDKYSERSYQQRLNRFPLGRSVFSPLSVENKVNEPPFFPQTLMDKTSDEKIAKLMEELNICYKNDCPIASSLLARSILERVLDVKHLKTEGEKLWKKDSGLKRKIDKCLEKNVFDGKAKEALNNLKSAKFLGDLAAHYNYIVTHDEVAAQKGPLHIIIEDVSDIKSD